MDMALGDLGGLEDLEQNHMESLNLEQLKRYAESTGGGPIVGEDMGDVLKTIKSFQENFERFSDGEKKLFREKLMIKLREKLGGRVDELDLPPALRDEFEASAMWTKFVVVGVAVLLLLSICAFFGYKLYRSLAERERKREDKKRLKAGHKKKQK